MTTTSPVALSADQQPPDRAPFDRTPFDRTLLRLHRDRAARFIAHGQHDDFLYVEIEQRLGERLLDLKRSFERVLVLGARGGVPSLKAKPGTATHLTLTDPSPQFCQALRRAYPTPTNVVCCEEEQLPFLPEQYDLIYAPGGLQWINDLPGMLAQVRQCLKPDGLFLGAIIAPQSLAPIAEAFLVAEAELLSGAGPRVAPGIDLRDAAGLLQRAGFALPVADLETITVSHSHPLRLFDELRKHGDSNALRTRPQAALRRDVLQAALEHLGNGEMVTTFQIIMLAGTAPAASQQKPLRPGSGKHSLVEALGDKTPLPKTGD